MKWHDTQFDPIAESGEATAACARVYSDREDSQELQELCIRLALGMVLSEAVRRAVGHALADELPATRGFIAQAARIGTRVRVTPLIYLVESDPQVASFVVRHAHVVPELLHEQGPVFEDDNSEQGLTYRIRSDTKAFLRRMKAIAPLLLDRADIGREHTEAFLQFLHRRQTMERLKACKSVREGLGPVLAEFCRDRKLHQGQIARGYVTPGVVDNILWQVALAEIQKSHGSGPGREVLEAVARRVSAREGLLNAEAAMRVAFAQAESRQPALVKELVERLETEYARLA